MAVVTVVEATSYGIRSQYAFIGVGYLLYGEQHAVGAAREVSACLNPCPCSAAALRFLRFELNALGVECLFVLWCTGLPALASVVGFGDCLTYGDCLYFLSILLHSAHTVACTCSVSSYFCS